MKIIKENITWRKIQRILFICITFFLVWAAIDYATLLFGRTKEQYETRLEETGKQIATDIRGQMTLSVLFVESMSEVFSEYQNLHSKEAIACLNRVCKKSQFSRMSLITPDGKAFFSDGGDTTVKENGYVRAALSGESGISEVNFDVKMSEDNVIIYAPIYHQGVVVGVITGEYELEQLSNIINVPCFTGLGYSHIIKKDGEIIVKSKHENVVKNVKNVLEYWENSKLKEGVTVTAIRKDLQNNKAGTVIYHRDNADNYGYYCPIYINDWYLFMKIPNKVLEADLKKNVEETLFLCLKYIFAVIILLAASYRGKQKLLRKMVQLDSMTQLLNHGAVENLISDFFKKNKQRSGALLLFDIDHFKSVNDTLGHVVGDALIIKLAEVMKTEFHHGEILGRLGGDEFAIFIKFPESKDVIIKTAHQFLDTIHQVDYGLNEMVSISVSMGIAMSPEDGASFETLYQKADQRMYIGKEHGGNTIETGSLS